MTNEQRLRSPGGFNATKASILIGACVGFVVTWVLFVTAPPDGLVSPYGIVISVLAGGYLMYLVYSYLKHSHLFRHDPSQSGGPPLHR